MLSNLFIDTGCRYFARPHHSLIMFMEWAHGTIEYPERVRGPLEYPLSEYY